jgi:hypothetical protein
MVDMDKDGKIQQKLCFTLAENDSIHRPLCIHIFYEGEYKNIWQSSTKKTQSLQ